MDPAVFRSLGNPHARLEHAVYTYYPMRYQKVQGSSSLFCCLLQNSATQAPHVERRLSSRQGSK